MIAEQQEEITTGGFTSFKVDFNPETDIIGLSNSDVFSIDPEPEIPESFFRAIADLKNGRVVDLEIAQTEAPPFRLKP
jgi:hypothetical protein